MKTKSFVMAIRHLAELQLIGMRAAKAKGWRGWLEAPRFFLAAFRYERAMAHLRKSRDTYDKRWYSTLRNWEREPSDPIPPAKVVPE